MAKKVVPMFHVPDVRKTVDWYRDIGFDVSETYDDGGDGLSFAMLRFGAGEVMFSSGGWTSPRHRREVDLYVYVDNVDGVFERLKDRVEVIEGPHNMFYGMREAIIRDLNGFWITFGEDVPVEKLAPWPAVARETLQPYEGTYTSDDGMRVRITIHNGRLLAFPDDGGGVLLEPTGGHTFKPLMPGRASVAFRVAADRADDLLFTQEGTAKSFQREAT